MTDTPHLTAIILAAGEGSRMKSRLPKPLHEVAGLSLLGHAMASVHAIGEARITVVVGSGAEKVRAAAEALAPDVGFATQEERLGTAHAVLAARDALGAGGEAVVLYADTPFIRPETLAAMAAERAAGADVVVLGFRAATPGGYGRLVMEGDRLAAIVEAKDADAATLAIDLCNSGVMMADAATLLSLLEAVGNENAKGEYYLTDIVGIANHRGLTARVVECPEAETMGVNDRADLATAEAAFQTRARAAAMAGGATLIDPATVWFSHDTALGRDVTVEPNVFFAPGVTVEDDATIRANSHLEGCRVASGAVIGPFARLRPGADIGADARVGNFVEVKNASFAAGAKANHLTYVGDASVGAGANIGAGVVTCNYDGVMKHRTEIGEGAFIGTNASLVAPVSVGERAYVATGSVVTRDVAPDALAISRARQEEKPGFASRLRARLVAMKAKRDGA
ncbi:MAG: bifunctional UDP-N-acetylglucosamine diphosphorylase/glucosamine-1-phosphate N-acetyltransferase GlmU [Pseudomonadota bacterium]